MKCSTFKTISYFCVLQNKKYGLYSPILNVVLTKCNIHPAIAAPLVSLTRLVLCRWTVSEYLGFWKYQQRCTSYLYIPFLQIPVMSVRKANQQTIILQQFCSQEHTHVSDSLEYEANNNWNIRLVWPSPGTWFCCLSLRISWYIGGQHQLFH